MSEPVHGGIGDGEAPVNPYTLLGAVNSSSDKVHTGWLIFIAIMSYLLVAVAGVTHKDLLLSRDIPLPILQVGVELTRFFLFAPVLVVLFHVGLMTQLVMLAKKTIELETSLRIMEATDRRSHPLRLELDNFFFVQAIAGPDRSRIVGALLHGATWLTLVVLPVGLLLYIQLVFLPYHDATVTWAHRLALVGDIALLALVGAFLSRPEHSLGRAMLRSVAAHPLAVLLTVLVLGTALLFSFLVATVPGERLDHLGRRLLLGESEAAGTRPPPSAAHGFVLPFPRLTRDGRLLGVFERNLNVTDHDLVNDRDVTPGEPSLNLRRRDLRLARLDRTDLHQADLTGANLDGASLVEADLRGVALHCADVGLLLLGGDRRSAHCPSARGANFTRARLREASLSGLDLTGARLEEADLTGATLAHAVMVGANLYSARLERADLTGGVSLEGANLAAASLQGADLTGASLYGADLSNAGLQGAVLAHASLHGASLRDADLEGADLFRAQLPAADLTGAGIRAASFREAWLWRAQPPLKQSAVLADLDGVRLSGPDRAEIAAFAALVLRMAAAGLGDGFGERLAGLLRAAGDAGTALAWVEIAEASRSPEPEPRGAATTGVAATTAGSLGSVVAGLGSLTDAGSPAGQRGGADRSARLTRYLASLACRPRWENGSVATGVARRAQGVGFNGDMAVLYERLAAPDCAGARGMPADALRRLANAVERQRGP